MNNFLKNNLSVFLVITALVITYFLIRIPNLSVQPIFADEAIYIRWAQVMKSEPTLRFLPLSDGKTPLFMWMMIPVFKIFDDPLFSGRILSTFSGLLTMFGVLIIGWVFISKRVGLLAAYLIAITPFFVFFDRLALVDSMFTAFSVWGAFLALLLIRYPRFDLAMLLGYVFGGSILTKTPGMFNLVSMPFSIILLNFSEKFREKKIVRIFILWLVTIIITLAIYNLLRLGPGFSSLNSRNQDYVIDPMTLLIRPWDPFLPHFNDLKDWLPKLLGWPLLGLIGWGGVRGIFLRNKVIWSLLMMSLVPLVIEMAMLKTFTARYILFTIPNFIIIGGFGLVELLNLVKKNSQIIVLTVLVLLAIYPAYFIFLLHSDIQRLPLPRNERTGYLEEWTAGYGLKEIAQYLDGLSKTEFLVVGTEGSFGTLPEGLQIYLDKNRQIAIIGAGATVSAQVRNASREHPTFFVANRSRYTFEQPGLELIKEYPKAKSIDNTQDAILFFKVKPINDASIEAKPGR